MQHLRAALEIAGSCTLTRTLRVVPFVSRSLPAAASSDKAYNVPTLTDMGYPEITKPYKVLYPGGETEALKRTSPPLASPTA